MTSMTRWPLIWTIAATLVVMPAGSTMAADPAPPASTEASAADAKARAEAEKEAKAKAEKEAKARAKAEKAAKAKAEKEARAAAKAEAAAQAKAEKEARKDWGNWGWSDPKEAAKAEKEAKARAERERAQAAAEAAKLAESDKARAEKEAQASGAQASGSATTGPTTGSATPESNQGSAVTAPAAASGAAALTAPATPGAQLDPKAEKKAKKEAEKAAKAAARAEKAAKAKAEKEARAAAKEEKANMAKSGAAPAGAATPLDAAAGGSPAGAVPVPVPAGVTPSVPEPAAAVTSGLAPVGAAAKDSSSMASGSAAPPSSAPAALSTGDPKADRKAKKAAEKAARAAAEQARRDERAAKKMAAGTPAEPRTKKSNAEKAYASGGPIAPLARRTSDETVFHDLDLMDQLEVKLNAMPATADPWRISGARKWVEASREEYLDNDETGFDQAAYDAAAKLVQELESGVPAMTKETVPKAEVWATSTRLRGELWEKLEMLKRDEGFPCAAAELAMLEVELQWAGHEQLDTGECDSDPHLQAAEQHAMKAQALAAACRKPEPTPIVVEVPKVEVTPMPTREELRIPMDVHFALARHDVTVDTRKVIEGVVHLLQKYPSIFVHLTGHTDSRGSYEYNLALSQRRVNAVSDVLRDMAIDSSRVTISFVGKSKLYAAEVSKRGYAQNRRVEMDFTDREGREITAERLEADLQIESDRPTPPPAPPKPKVRIKTPRSVAKDSTGAKPTVVAPKPTAAKPAAPKPTTVKSATGTKPTAGTTPRTTIRTKRVRPDSSMAGEDNKQ